ncbi:hypothetical protein GE09DRAFT_1217509 [Coniochaeta sp. 2T2.1]|nr:hypothetical protein GE09DRAFT_1217509 [Coniochaeta sp. 2T2.1]
MASSRRPAPTPLYISKRRTSSSTSSTMSPDYMTETTPLAPPPHHSRTSSSGSTDSACSSYAYASPNKKPTCPTPRNVYTTCGRHTDQYLFGGKGFSDMWRAITKKE